MKIYTLVRIYNPEYVLDFVVTSTVYASSSISKVVEYAKEKYDVVIDTLDVVVMNEDELYGYKVEEINIEGV